MKENPTLFSVVLAGGLSSRMETLIGKGKKALLPILDKTLIEINIDQLLILRPLKVIIITNLHNHEFLSHLFRPDKFLLIQQHADHSNIIEALGLALPYIKKGSYIHLSLADEYLNRPYYQEALKLIHEDKLDALIGIEHTDAPDEIKETYTFSKASLNNFVEKPSKGDGDFRGTGQCFFRKEALQTFYDQRSTEKDLVDIFNFMARMKLNLGYVKICEKYFNVNTPEDYLKLKSYLGHN